MHSPMDYELLSLFLEGMACLRPSSWENYKTPSWACSSVFIGDFLAKAVAFESHVLQSTSIPQYIQGHPVYEVRKVGLQIYSLV